MGPGFQVYSPLQVRGATEPTPRDLIHWVHLWAKRWESWRRRLWARLPVSCFTPWHGIDGS